MRKIIVKQPAGSALLTETPADNEAQLQELLKNNPDLLPIEEFNMTGPLLVVGRETQLPSGAVDLVGLARSGELILVEFKTGPQNADFRHVLAQLLDYGAALWGLSFEEFESTVAARYFAGPHCQDSRLQGRRSLLDAARAMWPDLTAEEEASLTDLIAQQLKIGAFHYVVAAQRFRESMEQTVDYMNAAMTHARFYAVELVRFVANDTEAFASRTLLKPGRGGGGAGSPVGKALDPDAFLELITDDEYRETLKALFEVFSGLKLNWYSGTSGSSIRMLTPESPPPLSIAWLFPPGTKGWMGLQNLNLGFDPASAKNASSAREALDAYVTKVEALPGTQPVGPQWLRAFHLTPEVTIRNRQQITEILAELVSQINGSTSPQ